MRILSLGAGVQSSTIALMAEHGELPAINHAIFADTQAEPQEVYNWLNYLQKNISFPIHRVTVGSLREAQLSLKIIQKGENAGKSCLPKKIPAFVKSPDGSVGMFGRKRTHDFKIIPIQRKVKELLEIPRFNKKRSVMCEQIIGISADEAHLAKPSDKAEIKHMFPLLDLWMTRNDCEKWMLSHGYPAPPKSACNFCPFHGDDVWKQLMDDPVERESIVSFERKIQELSRIDDMTRGTPYLHRSCVPIDQVEFMPKTNLKMAQIDMFGNECEGLCGV